MTMALLDAEATAAALPWGRLVEALERTLRDQAAGRVQVPERWVLPLTPGSSWFVMPAWLAPEAGDLAAIKLITYAVANAARGLPAILGDVLVLRASSGERLALLDGPAVTARRTAAVSLLAARRYAARAQGPLLLIGTGVQARSHLRAFVEAGGVREVWVRGRSDAASQAFVDRQALPGVALQVATELGAALQRCPLIVTATSATSVCLRGEPRDDAFVAAIGAFTAAMIEIDPALTRAIAARGLVLLDSPAARHEAGDLLTAGLAMSGLPCLADEPPRPAAGPVLFKSCGSALWDLAAARCVADGLQL